MQNAFENAKHRPAYLGLCLAVFAHAIICCSTALAKTGSWGDQGDGTYNNPILNADYPDVDVEQVGDTYYMISSKQHMCPGMVILESKDMVNWTTIGHVWDKLSWAPEYSWDAMQGYPFGVWAGDFTYQDGKWYCYQIDFRHGLFMSTATDLRGPWTQPYKMLPTESVFDDPAVFWDQESKVAYLICNAGRKRASLKNKSLGNENYLFKMSWDGREILDEGTLVYTGPGAEAAKIYKIDNTWYLFFAEWRGEGDKRDRKQIVLRSKTDSIYGPYDRKVVFERGNGIERSCSQGGLMQAPNGSWWYTHQLIQNIPAPFQGRPQCLEPVEWVDGWPMIGEDIDNDGIGEPVLSYKKPIDGFPVNAPPSDDEFDLDKLGLQWEWNHNPRDSHWSLTERPGFLRINASVPIPPAANYKMHRQVFWRACNTVSQRIMGTTTGTATAKLDLSGLKPGQKAGFVRFGAAFHLIGVHANDDGTRKLFLMDHDGKETQSDTLKGNDLFIRTSNEGDRASFEFSVNGKTFKRFGPEFTVKFGNWTGDRLGFFCWNESLEDGYLDIDYFHYDYDGPKAVKE
ncbi:glycoside hydrolase 43 family protein [Planctomycetes bacterium CA13]